MNREEQRAIVATELMKYKQLDNSHPKRYFEPTVGGGWVSKIEVDDYHPDLEDNESLGQRRDLLDKLKELGATGVCCGYFTSAQGIIWYYAEIDKPPQVADELETYSSENELSEGAALLEAASKLAKELGQ